MRAALATHHMGKVITAYRTHPFHGATVSQTTVAAWARCAQPHMSRIENGPAIDSISKLISWSKLLGIPKQYQWFTGSSVKSIPIPPSVYFEPGASTTCTTTSRNFEPATASSPISQAKDDDKEESMLRRDFISSSLAVVGLSILPHATGGPVRMGMDDVVRLRARIARLRNLDNFLGGADTYEIYKKELSSTVSLANKVTATAEVRKALLSVISEQALQAGWASFDAGSRDKARHLFEYGKSAAIEASNSALHANSLAFIAYQGLGSPTESVKIAQESCSLAGNEVPHTVRALLFERLAWAHAKAGQVKETEIALEAAGKCLREVGNELQPDWSSWVDQRELQIMTGRCWAELGRPLRAVTNLEKSLASFDNSYARDKALYSTWLAKAYLDAREVEQSAEVLERAIVLSRDISSIRPRERILSVAGSLRPYAEVEAVDRVLERASSQL